jgi:hypothetical protein
MVMLAMVMPAMVMLVMVMHHGDAHPAGTPWP